MKRSRVRGLVAIVATAVVGVSWGAYLATAAEDVSAKQAAERTSEAKADGAELFNREWLPKDARAHGGDGLGPVFNDSSCVACHNQGGAGGGGPASKNVDVISVFSTGQPQPGQSMPSTLPEAMFRSLFGGFGANPAAAVDQTTEAAVEAVQSVVADPKELAKKQKAELAKIHPGFVNARSVVLHKASTDPRYDALRAQLLGEMHAGAQVASFAVVDADIAGVEAVGVDFSGDQPQVTVEVAKGQGDKPEMQPERLTRSATAQQIIQQHRNAMQQFHSAAQGTQAHIGSFAFLGSQRNPTALFGAGLIDSIPDEAIKANVGRKHKDFPEVQGRVARLKDGRIGRFGWKNQTASLYDFAMTACAVELGLEVPEHAQAGLPQNPDYKAPATDMTKPECDALVDYLKKLPAPEQTRPANEQESSYLTTGETKFVEVGCATCHVRELGDVKGVYSDLLLHDMGQDLGDTGQYGVFVPNAPEEGGDEPIPSLNQPQLFSGGMGVAAAKADREKTIGALRQEWRTPPLWGVRDSAPYLHDGRADSLEQAIALHGGEASRSAQRFFELKPEERMQVVAFLKSLRAPQTQVASR
jgi:CxxC motif-containing protein (DUF1111 family)